jgi:Zn-dependent protease
MQAIDAIFYIAILVMSIVIHEVMHGFAAEYFGDDTARDEGRLTLNPLKHLDLFGSIILPAFLILTKAGFLFGWAKPVPYNPNNLRDLKWGTFWVAISGVLANFFIALVFGLIIRFSLPYNFSIAFYNILSLIVMVNLSLGIFNLVPIPPLDGSKILFSLLPRSFYPYLILLEQYSLIVLLVFVVFLSNYLYPVMALLFHWLTGLVL